MVTYTEEEKEFVRAIYLANREEREPWRTVVSRFRERFGRPLGQGQLRYLRLRYVFPNGQADDPRYQNRRRGKKLEARAAAAARAEEASDQESSAQDSDMNAFTTPSPYCSPAPTQSSQASSEVHTAQESIHQTAAMFNQLIPGGLSYQHGSFPIAGREHLHRQYGSATLSSQGHTQRQLGPFPPPLGQGQTQWQNGSFTFFSGQGHGRGQYSSFPPPLGGQGQIQGHHSFPPPSGQGQPREQRASFPHVSAQEQHGFFPPPPTEYGQIDLQQNFWTPPMTPTYPLTLEQYRVPRYPTSPFPGFAPNGQNGQSIIPAEAGFTDGQACPEPESSFDTELRLEDFGPEDFANLRETAPENPIEQPFPSDVLSFSPPAEQQTYDDNDNGLFTFDASAQTPRSEQTETDAGAGENAGLTGDDLDDGRFEEFMGRLAWNVADRQQPEGGAQGGHVEGMEAGFDGEFEREMNRLGYGLETPRSTDSDAQLMETDIQPAETGVQSPNLHAQLEQDIEQTESKCGEEE